LFKPISDTPFARFDRSLVVRIRDKAAAKHGRRFANYVKAVLSILFSWGAERNYLKSNPRREGEERSPPEGRTRSESGLVRRGVAVLSATADHIRPAIALMMFTGLGPKDALRLPRSFFKQGELATRRSKTGEPIFWPAPSALTTILMESPAHSAITVCANSHGRPWTESGFRASWATLRRKLEKIGQVGPSLTLYGLRHTVAVILRECGFDERTIADALGQKTIEMARHYAKGADLKRKMRGVVTELDAEVNRRRTKVVKPDR
jgi:integrase